MAKSELNWMIGGPQGSGIDTSANIFAKACGQGGYHLYGKREYHSNIKGLHSYFHLRVSEKPISANVNEVDLLAAFDAETVVRHLEEVVSNGGVILEKEDLNRKISEIPTLPREFLAKHEKRFGHAWAETSIGDLIEEARSRGVEVFPVPFLDLLKEVASQLGIEKLSKITRIKNVLALGVTFGLLSYDVELVDKSIRAVFRSKVGVADMNISAHRRAYDYAKQNFGDRFPFVLSKLDVQDKRLLVSGFQAVALGKVFGGCRLQSYYPITPAADESEYLEAHEVFGLDDGSGSIVIMQAEDEIAAVNMASGAALTGVRTATATSGPGFSLMVEGLSWAGNNEVPIVITYYQRGAPSTGLPTRHGQDDLRFVIHAGHGEFPRIVLASGDIRECFYDAARALNYAEKYQTPVIHLVDKAIANSSQSLAPFDKRRLKIERGTIIKTWDDPNVNYKRFEFTNNYMSPRAFLGTPNAVMWYTGDEHDELGHISEEPLNRDLMMEKRMRKLEVASAEIPLEEKINFLGQKGAENILVSWGSPKGAVVEAMEKLHHEGVSISFLQVRLIHPFASKEIGRLLKESKRRIAVEMNYSGQLANIIAEKTGIPIDNQIVKYNGRPMTTTEVYEATRKIIFGKARKREVLTYGS